MTSSPSTSQRHRAVVELYVLLRFWSSQVISTMPVFSSEENDYKISFQKVLGEVRQEQAIEARHYFPMCIFEHRAEF